MNERLKSPGQMRARLRRWAPQIKKSVIIAVFGVILAAGFFYGVLVGKYRYPPFEIVAPIYQQFYDLKQFFVNNSPQSSEDAIKAEEQTLRLQDSRLRLVSGITGEITDVIVASYKPYDTALDSPIGYMIGYSVKSGDSIQVYIHNNDTTSVDVYRLGRARSKVESLPTLSPNRQSSNFSPYRGFDWNLTLTLETVGYESGYYLIELNELVSGNRYQIPFIVTPRESPRIALVSQTNTWNAYNTYGGRSYYRDRRYLVNNDEDITNFNTVIDDELPHVVHLPYARPYSYAMGSPLVSLLFNFSYPLNITDETRPEDPFDDHFFRSEWVLGAFAEEHELDYGVYIDDDLKVGGPILESEVIVFNTHSEYWSQDMLTALRGYIAKGGKVIFAGGNSIYREVEHTEYGMRVIRPQIPSYISTPMLGTSYTGDGFRTYAAYEVSNPHHWVFEGTGVRANDDIGAYSANQPGVGVRGEGEVGASGFETDKVNRYSELYAEGFETLAVGKNDSGPGFIVLKETEAGGWIFNAGSIAFTGALFHDPIIDRMMLNLLGS